MAWAGMAGAEDEQPAGDFVIGSFRPEGARASLADFEFLG